MINRLLFLILILITGSANALVATTPEFSIYNPSGTNAGGFIKGTGAIWQPAANAYSLPAKINIAGQTVNLVAKAPLAATALNFVRTSILSNPYLVVGSLLLAYYQSNQIAELNSTATGWQKSITQTTNPNTWYGVWTGPYIPQIFGPNYTGDFTALITGVVAYIRTANGCQPPTVTQYCPTVANLLPTCAFDLTNHVSCGGYDGNLNYSRTPYSPAPIPLTTNDWASIPQSLPDTVKQELPSATYLPQGVPVDTPVFDPQTVTIGQPYTKPDGSTAQPMAKISPQPDGKVGVDTYEQPLTDPQGNPIANPTPTDTPETPPNPSLCQLHPEILACQNLDLGPDTEVIQTDTLDLSLIPESVGGAGSCPAPINFSVLGHQMAFKYDLVCQGAGYLRPLILALAWLSAGIVFIGGVRGG